MNKLSKEERKAINKSEDDFKKGRTISHKRIMNQLKSGKSMKTTLKTYMELIEHISAEGQLSCNLKKATKVIGDIYTISHIAIGRCENKHPAWVEDWDKVIKKLKEMGEL